MPVPDATDDLKDLYLAGISDYNATLAGYVIRSPIVADTLLSTNECYVKSPVLTPELASCNHIFWQVANTELLLSLIHI